MRRGIPTFLLLVCLFCAPAAASPDSKESIRSAMKKASIYYRDNAARHGGYVYYYSPDFQRRLGEGVAEKDEIWVQPPGTPTVGSAWLAAYRATNDPFYLDAALETADALIYGQLQSGAWTNSINFDSAGSRVGQYRNGKGKGKNFSTLDDDISQSAIQFLVELDEMTQFQNEKVHEAATIALDALLAAQFPNGAFPQGWDETPAVGAKQPGIKANFPPYDWKTEGRIKEYWDLYTLNDGVAATVADTLLVAHRTYQKQEYEDALRRLGEFLIEAQMPAPQPAWAQQYNYEMQPVWARKFEPPAIASRESESAIATLLKIAVHFRDKRFLEPIPAALDYLESSELSGRRLARYYELQTNKPLYMERSGKQYTLTHSDKNLPSHYGWQNPSRVAELRSAWSALQQRRGLPSPVLPSMEKDPSVDEILRSLDAEGRWMSTYHGELLVGQPKFQDGEKYLNSAVFCRNITILSSFLQSGGQ